MRRLALAALLAAACGGEPGSDWTEVDTPTDGVNTTLTVWAFADDDVWLGGTSAWHFDGSAWEERPVPGSGAVLDFYGFDASDLWAIGDSAVYRWDGQRWGDMSATATVGLSSLWRIWGASPDAVWVANTDNSRVYFWDGSVWSVETLQFVFAQAMWGSSQDDVWLTGPFEAYHWDGLSWTEHDDFIGPGGSYGIWGSAADDVWAVGGTDELVHFDGSTWSAIEDDYLEDFNDIWGSAPNDVYAVGNSGLVGHYDGSSWSATSAGFGFGRNFTMLHGSSSSNVWATVVDLNTFTSHVYRLDL